MAIIVGTNSWVTIVEADDYLDDRMGAEQWFKLNDDAELGGLSKTSVLVSAFLWLSGNPSLTISPSSSDDNVKNAQIEAALWLHSHYGELDERRAAMATGLTDMRLSARTERLSMSQLTIPDHIMGLLVDYAEVNSFATLLGQYDA